MQPGEFDGPITKTDTIVEVANGVSNTGRSIHKVVGKLDRLVVFDAVVREGSLTGAAIALGVTQPAVSRQIALLEDELHTTLFQRENSRIAPTPQALALAEHIDAGLARFEEGLAELTGSTEVLTLAVQPAIAESWFAPRLNELREFADPSVIRLMLFEFDDELATLDHDVAIRFGAGFGRHYRSARLVSEVVTPVASPEYASTHALSAECSADELTDGPRLLQLDERGRSWMGWADWFDLVGCAWERPNEAIVHQNYGILLQQALAGEGVVLGWQTLLGNLMERRQLVPVGPTVERPHLGYHLVWPPSLNRHAGLESLRNWLVSVLSP